MADRKRAPSPKPVFIRKADHRYPASLTLHFDRPVSLREANQEARRLLDALQATLEQYEGPPSLGEAALTIPALSRRLVLYRE